MWGTGWAAARERTATGKSGGIDEGEASESGDGQHREAGEHGFYARGKQIRRRRKQ